MFSAALIGIGAYYSYSSSPKKVLKQTLTTVSNNINNLVSRDEKYRLDNTFSLESDIKTITWYDVTDPEMLEHKDFLNNYLNFESKIKIIQNEEKEKAYFHIHAKENNLDYMDLKYLIKESTGYYYNNYITNKYINMGTNNYFETISKDTNTRSNIEYLNTYIIDSLTNNISDKYMETSQEKVSLNNGDFNSDKISIELDNQKINDLFKLVLKDLKKDDKSSKILGNYFDGFNDYKLKNKKYLSIKLQSLTERDSSKEKIPLSTDRTNSIFLSYLKEKKNQELKKENDESFGNLFQCGDRKNGKDCKGTGSAGWRGYF